MDNIQLSKVILNYLVPFLIAYLGSKGIFYYFSFEYSLLTDAFYLQKLLIDIGVFVGLYYMGSLLVKYFISSKNYPAP
ncbi:hypothetical protein L0668_06945 [Paraglaciecola aquimarina]|uniref:Uncharacterized protein n=1 Tax=Paraglaciecola algarum TaxID=3050085 RepID=A0ABS9D4I7_9ALTE|nr:hypothetical protein [Paraglaciecola sp. G1-23]MCF2947836.1 hypothetical protein [Paraglaciecola sp. G1-23]